MHLVGEPVGSVNDLTREGGDSDLPDATEVSVHTPRTTSAIDKERKKFQTQIIRSHPKQCITVLVRFYRFIFRVLECVKVKTYKSMVGLVPRTFNRDGELNVQYFIVSVKKLVNLLRMSYSYRVFTLSKI